MSRTPPIKGAPEPGLFIRIFMATTGIITSISGLFAIVLTVLRLFNPSPTPAPLPRVLAVTFTFSFLLGFALQGACWVMAALSKRVWNSTF